MNKTFIETLYSDESRSDVSSLGNDEAAKKNLKKPSFDYKRFEEGSFESVFFKNYAGFSRSETNCSDKRESSCSDKSFKELLKYLLNNGKSPESLRSKYKIGSNCLDKSESRCSVKSEYTCSDKSETSRPDNSGSICSDKRGSSCSEVSAVTSLKNGVAVETKKLSFDYNKLEEGSFEYVFFKNHAGLNKSKSY